MSCSKCGSEKIIPKQPVHVPSHGEKQDLQIEICEKPRAWFFRRPHLGALVADICGECGFVEFFVSNPQELFAAYEKSQTGGKQADVPEKDTEFTEPPAKKAEAVKAPEKMAVAADEPEMVDEPPPKQPENSGAE